MPSRRRILAAIPLGLAGCTSSRPVADPTTAATPTSTPTPPEIIDECRAAPDPPAAPTDADAREFVAAYEETQVYNWLVAQNGGPDECQPDGPGSSVSSEGAGGPTDVQVEPAQTVIVTETDAAHYVVSSCSGTAEYWCPDDGRICASGGRNRHFVTHFVADERHAWIPNNWFVCRVRDEPHRAPDPDRNLSLSADEPGLTFRVYPFREDAAADVTLTYHGTDERILDETYSPNAGPAVQTNVTVATGDFELVVETEDERTVHEFSLTGRDDPAWNGVCVYVGPDNLHVVEVGTEGDLAVPESTCYDHRNLNDENGNSGS